MPHLTALRAENFRCFEQLSCALDPGVTVFLGANAQGKTSVLEAICVLLRLQSPRTSTLSNLARFGQPHGFGLAGDLILPSSPPLATNQQPPTASPRTPTADDRLPPPDPIHLKYRWHDGHRLLSASGQDNLGPARYLAHSTVLVWMGNEDLDLVRGSSEARRRYLDFLGTQIFPHYRPTWLAYDKALRSRNRLLKDDNPDPQTLAAYTKLLVEHGTILSSLRAQLVVQLAPWAAAAHHDISRSPEEILGLRYSPSATHNFPAALAASAPEEARRHITLIGPHRDDLLLTLSQRPAATFASEGQQRTIALALKLAQARLLLSHHQSPPILLLDDIFGELDPHRRNALLRALPHGSQQLITTTHLDWATHTFSPQHVYSVHHGTLTAR